MEKMMRLVNKQRGFTLVELMVVLLIIGILASIAIPSYRRYILRATRTEAKTALLRLQAAEEKFYLQNNRYAITTADMKAATPGGLGLSDVSENNNYSLTLATGTTGDNQSFSGKATALNGQAQDTDCPAFTIDNLGTRTPDPTAATRCWR